MNQYVEFEIGRRPEDGKLRANRLMVVRPEHGDMGPPGHHMGPPQEGQILVGTITKYDDKKGFGFISCDMIPEDVFFPKAEMPPELKDEKKDKIKNVQVEFELERNAEGKWRAKAMALLPPGGPPPGPPPGQHSVDGSHRGVILRFEPAKGYGFLRPDDIPEDVFFLRSEMPPELREAQDKEEVIQRHVEFELKTMPDGKLRALRLELYKVGTGDPQPQDAAEPDADEVPLFDDPAIPLGPGCQPHGIILRYDPKKGFGFIKSLGLAEEVYFPRSALPSNFQGKKDSDMPNLEGVQVSFDMSPNTDKGPRAERISLLLKWHADDACWLLKREADPVVE